MSFKPNWVPLARSILLMETNADRMREHTTEVRDNDQIPKSVERIAVSSDAL